MNERLDDKVMSGNVVSSIRDRFLAVYAMADGRDEAQNKIQSVRTKSGRRNSERRHVD